MFRKMLLAFAAITMLFVMSSLAAPAPTGCKSGKFLGTYTIADPNVDLFGDGSVVHSFVFQLTFNSDGTFNRYWTGFPDYMINLGSGSPIIGSWVCRSDGKIVATAISASYFPVDPSPGVPDATKPDISLARHFRTTYLFSVKDDNTLTQIQRRSRSYTPSQDPTDPNGGMLGALNNSSFDWNRLIASDADLLAPTP